MNYTNYMDLMATILKIQRTHPDNNGVLWKHKCLLETMLIVRSMSTMLGWN